MPLIRNIVIYIIFWLLAVCLYLVKAQKFPEKKSDTLLIIYDEDLPFTKNIRKSAINYYMNRSLVEDYKQMYEDYVFNSSKWKPYLQKEDTVDNYEKLKQVHDKLVSLPDSCFLNPIGVEKSIFIPTNLVMRLDGKFYEESTPICFYNNEINGEYHDLYKKHQEYLDYISYFIRCKLRGNGELKNCKWTNFTPNTASMVYFKEDIAKSKADRINLEDILVANHRELRVFYDVSELLKFLYQYSHIFIQYEKYSNGKIYFLEVNYTFE